MKTLVKVLTGIVLAFAVMIVALTVLVWNMPEVREVREFEKQFQQVAIGDPEQKAVEVLGEPDVIETEFRLGQQSGFEEAYARAAASGSDRYLVYFRGIDVVFSVGISKKGKVSVTESGGT
ncbi:MAG: hypothetical protein GY801_51705 [bacterium]|nr:hypothetical protein [bacterium]